MKDCKHLIVEDVTPLFGDVFGHPDYKYICEKTGKKILVPYIHCIYCENYIEGE